MSQKNVEIVRRFFEAGQRSLEAYRKNPRSGAAALEAGDSTSEQEEVLAFLHPEVEVNTRGFALQGGPVRGHLGWLACGMTFSRPASITRSPFAGWRTSVVVKCWGRQNCRQVEGQRDGAGRTVWYLATLRNGLIVRFDSYLDRKEALEAVGLSE